MRRIVDLSNSDVNGTDMRGANMREMDLTNADFTGSRMGGVDLKGAHFCNTLLPSGKVIAPRKGLCPGQIRPGPTGAEPIPVAAGSPLYPAISALQNGTQVQAGERVRGCVIEAFTKCRGADLKGTSLQGGFLAYADLNGADLRGVNFQLGSVAFGNAAKAKLDGAALGATSIVNADLRGASMRQVSLGLTVLTRRRPEQGRPNPRRRPLLGRRGGQQTRGATLAKVDFAGANFAGADLRGADLSGTDLSGTTLVGAKLNGAKLKGATYCNTLMPGGNVRRTQRGPSGTGRSTSWR